RHRRPLGLSGIERHPGADVERRPLAPRREGRRGDERVEILRELEALLRRQKLVDRERADLRDRRLAEIGEELLEAGRLATAQAPLGEVREEHVLAAARRIGIALHPPEEETERGGERLA